MRVIISPAKKMRVDRDSFPVRDLPLLLPKAEILVERLRSMSYEELKALWKCNDSIAALNIERLQSMDLHHRLTPAILSYDGIQYQYMAPSVFTAEELEYVQGCLRILSGLYGVLRPFDGVTPYRLEMQARFSKYEMKDLYSYWGSSIAEAIWEENTICFSVPITEDQHLQAELSITYPEQDDDTLYKIISWKTVNTKEWKADRSQNLYRSTESTS